MRSKNFTRIQGSRPTPNLVPPALKESNPRTPSIPDAIKPFFPELTEDSEQTVVVAFTAKPSLWQRITGKSRVVFHIVAVRCPGCGIYNLLVRGPKAWSNREGDFHSFRGRNGFWETCLTWNRNPLANSKYCWMPGHLDRVPDELWEEWRKGYDEHDMKNWIPRHSYFWVDLDESVFTEQEMTYPVFAFVCREERKEEIWQKYWKGKVTLQFEWSIPLSRKSRPHESRQRARIGTGPACPKCGSGTIPSASHAEYKKRISQTYSCINEKCKHRWVERD